MHLELGDKSANTHIIIYTHIMLDKRKSVSSFIAFLQKTEFLLAITSLKDFRYSYKNNEYFIKYSLFTTFYQED